MKGTQMNIILKTLTPHWTGGVDGTTDCLRETGIIGSLRWWYEVIIRGLGGWACDPFRHECPDKDGRVCDACAVFGTTGRRRKFALRVEGGDRLKYDGQVNIRPRGSSQGRGWYLGAGIIGELPCRITPLDKDFNVNHILIPLKLASGWGGIGAKTQSGYGVVTVSTEDGGAINFDINALSLSASNANLTGLTDLKEMFFLKVGFEVQNDQWWKSAKGIHWALNPENRQLKVDRGKQILHEQALKEWLASKVVPLSPVFKDWLRFQSKLITEQWASRYVFGNISQKEGNWCIQCGNQVRENNNGNERQEKPYFCPRCGSSKKTGQIYQNSSRLKTKVFISSAYKKAETWEIRLWGWLPENQDYLPTSFNRKDFLNGLKETLSPEGTFWSSGYLNNVNCREFIWREFNSIRDSLGKEENIKVFLQSLLDGNENT
ncbi:MAG TPA: type III-B CRISPR module RAMP protein Cmr1 [Desulfotomaculum sp.]|nr:type III-B CRISPR module RAMP protein Cmr1 [Desulfotomaculum sp.]